MNKNDKNIHGYTMGTKEEEKKTRRIFSESRNYGMIIENVWTACVGRNNGGDRYDGVYCCRHGRLYRSGMPLSDRTDTGERIVCISDQNIWD